MTTISIPGKCGNPDTIKFFHKMHSKPNKYDSDGDGFWDYRDPRPMDRDETIISANSRSEPGMVLLGYGRDSTNGIIRDIILIDSDYRGIFMSQYNNSDDFKNAVLIIDYSDDEIIDYCVYNSYMYSDGTLTRDTVSLIKEYNDSIGRTEFDRSIDGLVAEWAEHNLLYQLGLFEDQTKHTDLDANADGTPYELYRILINN